jgi:hypothetical protein
MHIYECIHGARYVQYLFTVIYRKMKSIYINLAVRESIKPLDAYGFGIRRVFETIAVP